MAFSESWSLALLVLLVPALTSSGQSAKPEQPSQTIAQIEASPLEFLAPEGFQSLGVLQPLRRLPLRAPADGIVLALPSALGAMVRENQEIVQLDRAEATARLKIAQAEIKEIKADQTSLPSAVAQARQEAAEARAAMAQLEVERCTLRAPFSGQIVRYEVSPGQFVERGDLLAELVDLSRLQARIPVDSKAVKTGDSLELFIDQGTARATVQALLPVMDDQAAWLALSGSWAVALVSMEPDAARGIGAGARIRSPYIPDSPVATVPARAVSRPSASRPPFVQVLRSEHVVTVAVKIIGTPGPSSSQVAGAFRPGDALILNSSVPLAEGTFVRFNPTPGTPISALPPDPSLAGAPAVLGPSPVEPSTTPERATRATRVAPIGQPDAAEEKGAATPPPRSPLPSPAPREPAKPATLPGTVPF